MPEGPEIRRSADRIEEVLKDQIIDEISFGLSSLKRHEKALQGQRVQGIETRGKAMLTHFENGMSIFSHNQLYGLWKVVKRGELPETKRSLRLALHTQDHSALLYSASDITVWPTGELSEHPFLSKIGPDVLSDELDWRALSKRLEGSRFSGRRLSALYLDQHFIAGIGNYLRSEILFAAGLDPQLRPKDLNTRARNKLARSTLAISQRSYETAGITATPGVVKALECKNLPYQKRRYMVFNREEEPCYKCGDLIRRIELNGRRLYQCYTCQPLKS